ncbi:DUF4430 domain-containing protein [Neobacillus terrae]|uniref:DUF4430 domain-containing protein n=1 Tax=Neobacillus terrae TaxID=3034837 RepID=UPI00140CF430|nr:DUF4430 domain-containing protein [Neobacillus terrae]NHM32603.1 DUF4430 domain-containing protein [Neobacillus terrae]
MFANRQTKIFLMMVLLLAMLTGGLQKPVLAAEQAKGTVTVTGSDQTGTLLPETNVTYTDKENAFEALVNAVGKDNVQFTQYSFGKMVEGIKGLKSTYPDSTWEFYINGIQAQTGAEGYFVKDNDKLTFRYADLKNPAPSKTVNLSVVGKNNESLLSTEYPVSFLENANAYQLLRIVAGSENVGFKQYDFGKMVTSIKGVETTGADYWGFYVNGKMADVGAEDYKLQPNDKITFKYEVSAPAADTPSQNTPADSNTTPAKPIAKEEIQKSIDSAVQYVQKDQVSDWEAIALRQSRKAIPSSYLEGVINQIKSKNGHFTKITDYERFAMGILAAGGNPSNAGGYDLIKSIYNGNITKQGMNGVAYALIALDSTNAAIPASATWTKQKIVNELLSNQNKDGGWPLYVKGSSDPDVTAMVLTALAPHKTGAGSMSTLSTQTSGSGVQSSIDKGVNYIKELFQSGKISNSSTVAQAVIALSAVGMEPNGVQKNGIGLVEYLKSFQNPDGGFFKDAKGPSDPMASEQGIQALVAYQLYTAGKGSLYSFANSAPVKVKVTPVQTKPAQAQTAQQTQTVKQPVKAATATASGHPLPKTASNTPNLIVFGVLIILMGLVSYFRMNRNRV